MMISTQTLVNTKARSQSHLMEKRKKSFRKMPSLWKTIVTRIERKANLPLTELSMIQKVR